MKLGIAAIILGLLALGVSHYVTTDCGAAVYVWCGENMRKIG